jgi:uncharacterized protein (TIGR02594 family)
MERIAITRRTLVLGALAVSASPSRADDSADFVEYSFQDYFSNRGKFTALEPDIEAAESIAGSMPKGSYLDVMQRLSEITQVGSTGELFNTRWKKFGNPLIVRFFHDIGYKETPYPGDCTPWCAATVAWCLQRTGRPIPSDAASSQSFLKYGKQVSDPVPGDLCVFTDVSDHAHGHVGIYMSSHGETLSVLGGNQAGNSTTNCGPGFRRSKITIADIPINPKRERSVGVHYLAAYVRPPQS